MQKSSCLASIRRHNLVRQQDRRVSNLKSHCGSPLDGGTYLISPLASIGSLELLLTGLTC